MNNKMKIALKISAGLGITSLTGIGIAGFVGGSIFAKAKKDNTKITDTSIISSFSNNLFSASDQPNLADKAKKNKGLKVLNLGDSVGHGTQTWQILNNTNFPTRGESSYSFLLHSLLQNGLLHKDQVADYSTSKSGLKAYELLDWLTHGKFRGLENNYNSQKERKEIKNYKDLKPDNKTMLEFFNGNRNLKDKVKESDIITISIGGNDLLRLIKVMGREFHDVDFDKLTSKLKGEFSLSGLVGFDLDNFDTILTDLENNIEEILQIIHLYNPNAVIAFFETPFPGVHWPKILRHVLSPIYDKIKEVIRRVIKQPLVKNDGVSPDVHGVVHSIYEQAYIDADDNAKDAKSIEPTFKKDGTRNPKSVQNKVLNWVSFAPLDSQTPGYGANAQGTVDPYDIYSANSLDIHPTIEGQAKIAKRIVESLIERFNLPKKVLEYFEAPSKTNTAAENELYGSHLTGAGVKSRIKKVREYHSMGTQRYYQKDIKARNKDLADIFNKMKVDKEFIETNKKDKLDPDYATGTQRTIAKEKEASNTYSLLRSLTGIIDSITDRIYLRRRNIYKDFDFATYAKSSSDGKWNYLKRKYKLNDNAFRPKSFKEYRSKTADFGSIASTAYEIAQNDMSNNPELKGYNDSPMNRWTDEKISWYINKYDGKTSKDIQEKIDAWKFGDAIMKETSSIWDLDEDGRYTFSDAQLSILISLLSGKGDILEKGGPLDEIVNVSDMKNLFVPIVLSSLSSNNDELTQPDYNDKKGVSLVSKSILTNARKYYGAARFDELNSNNNGLDRIVSLLKAVNKNWEKTYKDKVDTVISGLKSVLSLFSGGALDFFFDETEINNFLEKLTFNYRFWSNLFGLGNKIAQDKKIIDQALSLFKSSSYFEVAETAIPPFLHEDNLQDVIKHLFRHFENAMKAFEEQSNQNNALNWSKVLKRELEKLIPFVKNIVKGKGSFDEIKSKAIPILKTILTSLNKNIKGISNPPIGVDANTWANDKESLSSLPDLLTMAGGL